MNRTNNILYIDTSDNKKVRVGIKTNDFEDILERESTVWKAQAVLPLTEEVLQKHAYTLRDITAIEVHSGPGSFTGLRVGVSIANTLGTYLHIPINGKNIGETIDPIYQ